MIEEFTKWVNEISPEMEKISNLISIRLNDEPEGLLDEILTLDAHKNRISLRCSESERWLSLARKYYLNDHIDKKESEKKICIEANVADIKRVVSRLEYMHRDIESKIDLGRSVLAYCREKIVRTTR